MSPHIYILDDHSTLVTIEEQHWYNTVIFTKLHTAFAFHQVTVLFHLLSVSSSNSGYYLIFSCLPLLLLWSVTVPQSLLVVHNLDRPEK